MGRPIEKNMRQPLSDAFVTADQLEAYAIENRLAEELLPDVLRRLVLSSVDAARILDFPVGRAIYFPGWDGHVDCDGAKLYVPVGVSGWELTVRLDNRPRANERKANEDYSKRTLATDSAVMHGTSYIHWTLRKWSGREEWARTKAAEAKWSDVRAYDCSDLITWLIEHPAIHIWLSRRMGKVPPGVLDTFSQWSDWSESAKTPLPRSIVTHGYEVERTDLIRRLESGSAIISVQWEHPKLAAAFVAAVLSDQAEPAVEKLSTRCVFVKTIEAFEDLVQHHKNLILVMLFEPEDIGLAKHNGHQIVLLLGREAHQAGDVVLRSRTQSTMYDAIGGWEPDETVRRQLATKAAAKFWSFYRSLLPPNLQQPSWSDYQNVSLLLAGQWDSHYPGDREILTSLTGKAFEEEEARAIQLARIQDPLFRQDGTKLDVIDLEEAWAYLGRHVADEHIESFEKAIVKVFAEEDPQYLEEDPEKAASIGMFVDRQGKITYSMKLRSGLAATLCYLGACDPDLNETGRRSAHACARRCVRLLYEAAPTWQAFCSLAPHFTNLAEADPDGFLTHLEEDIKTHPEKIRALFREATDFFIGGHSPHPNLLWALELIAWDPSHLVRVARALVRIAGIDPGGNGGNRPMNSLREIFLAWHPSTLADRPQRMAALERVLQTDDNRGWDLVHDLLPTNHQMAMPTHSARYRPWGPLWQGQLTQRDVYETYESILELAVAHAGKNGHRWCALIRLAPNMSTKSFDAIFEKFESLLGGGDFTEKLEPFEALRKTIAQHRSHPDAEWVMKPERLNRLELLLGRLEPTDPSESWVWVFGHHAVFELGPGNDFEAKNKEIERLRIQAASEVLAATSIEGLLEFADRCENPNMVGHSFAALAPVESVDSIVERAYAHGASGSAFVWGFLWGVSERHGQNPVLTVLASDWGRTQSPEIRGGLLRTIPLTVEAVAAVDGMDSETQAAYWSGFRGFLIVRAPDAFQIVLDRLMTFDAWATAVDTLAMGLSGNRAEVSALAALDLLERAVASPALRDQVSGNLSFEIGTILDYIEKDTEIDEVRIARLEFQFAGLLSHTRRPRVLNRVVTRDPGTFVFLLRSVFNPRNAPEGFAEEPSNRGLARLAYEVLDQLELIPGSQPDGSISAAELLAWATEARKLSTDCYRGAIFESKLGELLSKAPRGVDGLFPHEAVRELFEEWESTELESGFIVGIRNGRGIVTKAFDEGGDQERVLGNMYQLSADGLSARWPRIGRALRILSEAYFDEAKREDRDVTGD